MTLEQIAEAEARHLVDVGRSENVSDDIIKGGLLVLKKALPHPLQKMVLQRVINDMDGNPVLKFTEGGSS